MKGVLVCFALSALVASVAYWSSSSLPFSLLVLSLYLTCLCFLCLPRVLFLQRKRRIRRECYRFMNAFLTTCSVTNSLSRGFQAACEGAEGEMKETIESIQSEEVYGRLLFMTPYFESPLYEVFLSIVDIYQNRGGDIISLSGLLLEEATKGEEEAEKRFHASLGKLLQYGLLWGMSLGIVAFLRFALSTFYASLLSSSTFLLSLLLYFLFLLGSLVFYCFVYTKGVKFWVGKKKGVENGKKGG